jgi:copper chaperone CopZ
MQNDQVGREQALETRDIGVAGMTCENCVRRVETALRSKAGVQEVHVDRAASRATITFDRRQTDISALREALLKSGFQPTWCPST